MGPVRNRYRTQYTGNQDLEHRTCSARHDRVSPPRDAQDAEHHAWSAHTAAFSGTYTAEINRLGRTIWRWRHQIANWHAARVTNAATEAANNLAKRVKRAAFGFTNFNNYRIRALLYAGKPNWALLDTLTQP